MVRIPQEYQEVEYLESTGTQYFFTDVDIQDGLTVDSVQTIARSSDTYLFGGRGDSNTGNKTCFNGGYGSRVQGAYPDNYYLCGTLVFDDQTKYHIVSVHSNSRRMCTVNGTEVANVATDAFVETTGKCLCFGWNKYGTPSNRYKGKVYSIKVSKGDALLADYIPCYRISDNVAGMYDTVSKQFYTNDGTGEFLIGNPVSYDTTNLLELRRRILMNTPHLESLSGSMLSFKTDMASKLKECRIHFTPIQEGSGDPSPDNVRPISGWDGIEVTRCGKNLIPSLSDTDFWERNAYIDRLGRVISSSSYKMCDYKPALPNKDYRFTNSSYTWVGIGFYDSSYAPLNFIEHQGGKVSLISPNDAKYYRLYAKVNAYDLYLETSDSVDNHVDYPTSSFTAYEPYQATTLTIPFPQTIYGGYVDLVKGEVVEEWNSFVIDGTNYCPTSSRQVNSKGCAVAYDIVGNKGFSGLPRGIYENVYRVKADTVKSFSSSWSNLDQNCIHYGTTVGYLYIRVGVMSSELSDVSSASAIEASMRDWLHNNPIRVAYHLATPTTYPLDPVTIRTLKGLNNIWSDANGNIEIKYWTH